MLTFDCIINSGCYWDFQYLAFSPVCSLLLGKEKKKQTQTLVLWIHYKHYFSCLFNFSAVEFEVVENSFIQLMEDTLLTESDAQKIKLSVETEELFISSALFC